MPVHLLLATMLAAGALQQFASVEPRVEAVFVIRHTQSIYKHEFI